MINVGVEGNRSSSILSGWQTGIVVLDCTYREANLDTPDLDGDADSIGTETSV